MSATREEILECSRELLNARGLSGLSVRAVAQELGLSPGNVSYHFPRRQHLVAALVQRLAEQNREAFDREVQTVADLLELFSDVFTGQWRFRGLVIALPDTMETFDEIRARYRANEPARRRRLFDLLDALRARRELSATDVELSRLVSQLAFLGRFWIAEARITYGRHGKARVIAHYLALVAHELRPYTTRAARPALEPYLAGWIDAAG